MTCSDTHLFFHKKFALNIFSRLLRYSRFDFCLIWPLTEIFPRILAANFFFKGNRTCQLNKTFMELSWEIFFFGGSFYFFFLIGKKMCIYLNPVFLLLESKETLGWENTSSKCWAAGKLAFIKCLELVWPQYSPGPALP